MKSDQINELPAFKELSRAVEDKLSERGKLVSLTEDSEVESVLVCEDTEGEGIMLALKIVSAECESIDDDDALEALADYVNEKVAELLDGDFSDLSEHLEDIDGLKVLLNGEVVY